MFCRDVYFERDNPEKRDRPSYPSAHPCAKVDRFNQNALGDRQPLPLAIAVFYGILCHNLPLLGTVWQSMAAAGHYLPCKQTFLKHWRGWQS